MSGDPRRMVPRDMHFAPWRAHDGWTLRGFTRLPAGPARGSLLFLGGRGDFVEKYLEALDHWHRAGWRTDGFDWRGQGGSGRLLADPLVCHSTGFEPLIDDLEAYIEQWRPASPGPHVAVCHSLGAHILLRLLARRRGLVDGAVLLAPMVAISVRPLPAAALRILAASAVAAGFGQRPLWRGDIGNRQGRMTSCPDRQADKMWWKRNRPDIASGPPSWRWLHSALASIRRLEADPGLAAIDLPLLILASRRDPVIDARALRRAAARLPGARLHLLPGSGHELLREADRYRLPAIERIDAFLDGLSAKRSAAWSRV